MIEKNDFVEFFLIVYLDVVFCLFMVYIVYGLVFVLIFVLMIVIQVFENFIYYWELVLDDGLNVVFEFSVDIGDKKFKGIDFICFNEVGQIVEFEVMVCLMSGLQVLGVEMGKWFVDQLLVYKIRV